MIVKKGIRSLHLITGSLIYREIISIINFRLVYIILNFYAPGWFYIKPHPKIEDGARNFFKLIKLASLLRCNERAIIHRVLLSNSFFAHHENILLSMLTDKNPDIRKWAIQIILSIRKKKQGSKQVLR